MENLDKSNNEITNITTKSDAIDFFNWVNKGYWKSVNGWIPNGWGAYASGYTIEELYNKFLTK
jgi:hypothetical protein